MSLSDVAALARVQRSVVSMWRTRSATSDNPFPAPARTVRGRDVFDAAEVATWLASTGRGNNAEATADVAAFAAPSTRAAGADRRFQTLTSLLALREITGWQLGALAADQLLDAADDCDPDDAFLFRELEHAGQHLPELARYTDALVDAAFNVAAAFEKLMDGRFRTGLRAHTNAALSPEAVALVAAAAVELSRQLGPDAVFVDSTPGGSDVLLGIVQQAGEERSPVFVTAQNDGEEARLVQRRLRVHGSEHRSLRVDESGAFELTGPAVHVCQYPSPASPGMAPWDMLLGIDNTLLQMDDDQRAVIVAPARVLCDAPATGGDLARSNLLRSDLLRSGRVRAVIRLPQGLVRSKPREAQALWVLGPSLAGVDIAERWTMVADLSAHKLTDDVVQDLIADIAASMGDRAAVRSHSFRFARLVFTRSLLAGQASLVAAAGVRAPAPRDSGAQAALRAEELLRLLAADPPPLPGTDAVLPAAEPGAVATTAATIGTLLAAGILTYLPGNRILPGDLTADGPAHAGGTAVIGSAELSAPGVEQYSGSSRRSVDLLHFAARYPSGRLTEPGDIVFCTSPRPAAVVDQSGGAVVVLPARVLRINARDPRGLHPFVIAADINAQAAGAKNWRTWRLRHVPNAQRVPLTEALAQLQHAEREARQRLARLEELGTLIRDGVAGGSLRLAVHHAPPEGTP
ncbi:hypothetical protein IV500_14825 [Paeniglutamicibacter antarcticus]|uniref:DNA methylase adenine-specific domain-containing protein n=2 Tax=Arthrobacter terrae TaxID=2935737 RepID=A0A931G5B2_9MICC|nr:hypothetical protein [Arthrobacter terrae]